MENYKYDIELINPIVQEIVNICNRNPNLNIKKVILFGPFAKYNYLKRSDIDLAVEWNDIRNSLDYFNFLDELNKIKTLRNFDILDITNKDLLSNNILNEVEKYGKIIYGKI